MAKHWGWWVAGGTAAVGVGYGIYRLSQPSSGKSGVSSTASSSSGTATKVAASSSAASSPGPSSATPVGTVLGYSLHLSTSAAQVQAGSAITVQVVTLRNVQSNLGNVNNYPLANQSVTISSALGTQTLLTNGEGRASTALRPTQPGTLEITATWKSPGGAETQHATVTVTAAPMTCPPQLLATAGVSSMAFSDQTLRITYLGDKGLSPGCPVSFWMVTAVQNGQGQQYGVMVSGDPNVENVMTVLSDLGWHVVAGSIFPLFFQNIWYVQPNGFLGPNKPS